tara:strand:- start:306 stop:545 length:240 start_codon:yes stop_codon:yes gene_type:complete
MTKNQLINVITSLKIDLKYLKKNLQFRLDGNDIEGATKKYENNYPSLAGTFEAYARMDNDTFKRSIKAIENMEKELQIN